MPNAVAPSRGQQPTPFAWPERKDTPVWKPRHTNRLASAASRGLPARGVDNAVDDGSYESDMAATGPLSDLGYVAFVQLHQPRYLRYARARLLDRSAGRVAVDTTFGIVAGRWESLLREPRPAADAWRQLRSQVNIMCCGTDRRPTAIDRLYGALPAEAADAVVLHCRLRMPMKAAADLMGVDPPVVAALLLTAMRQLPATTLEHLEERIPQV